MVTFALLKEEAGAKFALVRENLGHCAGDYRLASTCYTV